MLKSFEENSSCDEEVAALAFAAACLTLQAQSQTLDPHQKLTLDIYRELIEINTVHPHGENTAAARAMAKRLVRPLRDSMPPE